MISDGPYHSIAWVDLMPDVPKFAIILSGGEGTRLRPLTYEIPKPLVPVQGKAVLEHLVDELFYYGVEEVVLSIGYKADKIIEHFDKTDKKHRIDYAIEDRPLGTGGAIRFAYQKLKGKEADDFLCVNGDTLIEFDLAGMYRQHKKTNALATILVKEEEDVTGYGVVLLDGERIRRFVEKPDPKTTPSKLINTGEYIINKRIIEMMPDKEKVSLEKDVFERVVEKEPVYAYPLKNGQFWPTDNLERYEKAIHNWRDPKARHAH